MRDTGIFHPDFFYHPRPIVESSMLATVEIFEPTGERGQWVPGQGVSGNPYVLRWRGNARIQPNKDWRARAREQGLEFGATHAVRVQVPFGGNKLETVDASEEFKKDWMVVITDMPVSGTEFEVGMRLYVRNASSSSNAWVHNLLCDTNTRE